MPLPDIDVYKRQVLYYLRNLGAQGILKSIKGIIVGKPQDEMYYEEYKGVFKKIIKEMCIRDST